MAAREHKRLLLVVIDGLGSKHLKRAISNGHAPTIARLLEQGGAEYSEAVSPFPSLTPVCLATIVTGALPDEHRIPSLSWLHKGERRFVEYGSSFKAAAVEGMTQTIEDSVLNLNHVHLSPQPRTMFEVLDDAGLVTACINYLVFRGRTRHTIKYGSLTRVAKRVRQSEAVYGPRYFFLGELFGVKGAMLPQLGFRRPKDWSAAHVARWLMRNTDTDFLLLYLGQHDRAAHEFGPEDTHDAVRVADRSIKRVIHAMGGFEHFAEECALIVCADHGQSTVWPGQHHTLSDVFDDLHVFRGRRLGNYDLSDIAICSSNRCSLIYRTHDDSPSADWIAGRVRESPAADIVAWRAADGWTHVHRGECTMRVRRDPDGMRTERDEAGHAGWLIEGDPSALDLTVDNDKGRVRHGEYPDALARIEGVLACVNAGDVVVSARVGWEFTDIGGQYHTAGSHGSLHELDSVAPMITAGLDGVKPYKRKVNRLTDIYDYVLTHFDIAENHHD